MCTIIIFRPVLTPCVCVLCMYVCVCVELWILIYFKYTKIFILYKFSLFSQLSIIFFTWSNKIGRRRFFGLTACIYKKMKEITTLTC